MSKYEPAYEVTVTVRQPYRASGVAGFGSSENLMEATTHALAAVTAQMKDGQ